MKRRAVMQALAASPLLATVSLSAAAKTRAGYEINDFGITRLRVNKRGNWTIASLKTKQGLIGIGDASQSSRDEETIAYLKQFAQMLRGRSIFDVEWFRQAAAPIVAQYPRSRANIAASALEQCLWDLQGKALDVPCYQLFGGRIQGRIRVYANINRSADPRTPDGFAAMASRAIADGFDAIKLAPFDEISRTLADRKMREELTAAGIACVEAVRGAIGPDRDLLVDAHSVFNLEDAFRLAYRLEPSKLYWLEEVTPAEPAENLGIFRRGAPMKTAGGESIRGVAGFSAYIKNHAVDIVMPDVKVCGGMLEMKKIAAMAEGAGLMTSPHGPASPVGTRAAAHVMATVPNFNILEFAYGEVPWRAELMDPPERVDHGSLVLSEAPGLGFGLNEKVAAKFAI